MGYNNIVILTGDIQTGKSAALMQWITNKTICGFITPTVNNKKVFYNITEQIFYPYQQEVIQKDTLQVGKYLLSGKAFEIAKNIAANAKTKKYDFFVADEVGKLELNNSGHYATINQLLHYFNGTILLVVRQQLVDDVLLHFNISKCTVLTKEQLLHFQV